MTVHAYMITEDVAKSLVDITTAVNDIARLDREHVSATLTLIEVMQQFFAVLPQVLTEELSDAPESESVEAVDSGKDGVTSRSEAKRAERNNGVDRIVTRDVKADSAGPMDSGESSLLSQASEGATDSD